MSHELSYQHIKSANEARVSVCYTFNNSSILFIIIILMTVAKISI